MPGCGQEVPVGSPNRASAPRNIPCVQNFAILKGADAAEFQSETGDRGAAHRRELDIECLTAVMYKDDRAHIALAQSVFGRSWPRTARSCPCTLRQLLDLLDQGWDDLLVVVHDGELADFHHVRIGVFVDRNDVLGA